MQVVSDFESIIMVEKNREKIIEILEKAFDENKPLQVQLDKQIFTYYSRFSSDSNLLEDIQEEKHLLIAPLDPPIGNIKIITCYKVNLKIFTDSYLIESPVYFLSRPDIRVLQLSFPKELILGKQQRDAVRIDIAPEWGLIVKIIRPSGLSFLGQPVDLSIGGLSFFSLGAIPAIADKSRVKIIIQWPNKKKVARVEAIIIKHQTKDGNAHFRSRFLFESYKDVRDVEEITTALQRLHIKKRELLFGRLA